jgi:hypothetical protein
LRLLVFAFRAVLTSFDSSYFDMRCLSELQNGSTALHHAAEIGDTECVRMLIDAGADKDATDDVRRSVAVMV